MFDVEIDLTDLSSRINNKHFNVRFVVKMFVDYLKKNHEQDIESLTVKLVWNSVEIKVKPVDGLDKYELSRKISDGMDESVGFMFNLNKVSWRVNRYYDCTFTIW